MQLLHLAKSFTQKNIAQPWVAQQALAAFVMDDLIKKKALKTLLTLLFLFV